MMKIGFCVVPKGSVRDTAEYFRLADEMGLEYGGLADQTFSSSIYPILTQAASLTRRIKLGTCVTNPYTCHPLIHANAGSLLDEFSGGRFILGMGAGDETTIRSLGINYYKPLKMVRESVEAIRLLLAGKKSNYEGEILRVSNAKLLHKPRRLFPIYIGAKGPKMLQLAGEIGDGVLIDAIHPLEVKIALTEIKKGVEKRGKSGRNPEVIAVTIFSLDEDSRRATNNVKWIVALATVNVLPEVLERHDIFADKVSALRKYLREKGPSGVSNLVTGEMIDAFSIAGSPEECVEKIEGLYNAGVS
jgi:5,10-methylenetetrahydromethanopterin reductase